MNAFIKIIGAIAIMVIFSGCTTIHNDQSACTTDCNIGSTGYVGAGGDVYNDQSECTHDCNIGTTGSRVYSIPAHINWSANVVYYPYHLRYQRGPMVIYHH